MTPKQFTDTDGVPFPSTILDDRAGVRQARGSYSLAPPKWKVRRLQQALFTEVQSKAEQGAQCMTAGDFRAAFERFVEALDTLPEPREQWNAAGWLLVALGENAIRAGDFKAESLVKTSRAHARMDARDTA